MTSCQPTTSKNMFDESINSVVYAKEKNAPLDPADERLLEEDDTSQEDKRRKINQKCVS